MKKILMFIFVVAVLFGCQNQAENDSNDIENVNDEVEVVDAMAEIEKKREENYLKVMRESTNRMQILSSNINNHFTALSENPTLMFDSKWVEDLKEYYEEARSIYFMNESESRNLRVPKAFEEIHELNEEGYRLTVLSIEENIKAVETGNFVAHMEMAIDYKIMSNENFEKATKLIQELTESRKK